MGSFNVSCFASNNTISEGERARVFVTAQQRKHSTVRLRHGEQMHSATSLETLAPYADGWWQPLSASIQVEYADYGVFNLVRCESNRRTLGFLLENLVRNCAAVNRDDNEGQGKDFDLAQFIQKDAPGLAKAFSERCPLDPHSAELDEELDAVWAYLQEGISEGCVFECSLAVPSQLMVSALHESTYQALVRYRENKPSYQGESFEKSAFLARMTQSCFVSLQNRQKALEHKEVDEESSRNEAFLRLWNLEHHMVRSLRLVSAHGLERMPELSQYVSRCVTDNLAQELLATQGQTRALVHLLEPVLDDLYVQGSLDLLSLRFSPLAYAGQDYRNEIGQAFRDFIDEVTPAVNRSRDIARYGKFISYRMAKSSEVDAAGWSQQAGQWDAALTVNAFTTDEVLFESTLDLKTLKSFLSEQGLGKPTLMTLRKSS